MDVKKLIERLRFMGDRTKRHDYATGDYWNVVDEAADALEALEKECKEAWADRNKNQIGRALDAEIAAKLGEGYKLNGNYLGTPTFDDEEKNV